MIEIFSDAWMKQLQDSWNASDDITTPLAAAGFSARIRQMIRNPSLANPFMHHFELMQNIGG
jgi:hypothetical protein